MVAKSQPQLITILDQGRATLVLDPAFPGKLGRVGVFDLGATAAASDPSARTISVSGAPLTLQAQTAQTFNEAFAEGKELFKAGEVAGSLSFAAQGQ